MQHNSLQNPRKTEKLWRAHFSRAPSATKVVISRKLLEVGQCNFTSLQPEEQPFIWLQICSPTPSGTGVRQKCQVFFVDTWYNTDLTTFRAGILTAFRFLLNRGLDISLCKSDRISKAGIRFTGSWYIIRDGQCIGIWIVFEPATNNRTLSELRFYEVMLILFPDWSCLSPLQ